LCYFSVYFVNKHKIAVVKGDMLYKIQ